MSELPLSRVPSFIISFNSPLRHFNKHRMVLSFVLLSLLISASRSEGQVGSTANGTHSLIGDGSKPTTESNGTRESVSATDLVGISPLLSISTFHKDPLLTSAYWDVYSILSQPNQCSSFFRGSQDAVAAFNDFFSRIHQTATSGEVAVSMSGSYDLTKNVRTGVTFRLFDKVEVNNRGAFYRARLPAMATGHAAVLSGIRSGSRQERALILLHELGHLLMEENGQWLLPNDGNNDNQSVENSKTVIKHCHSQLWSLK